MRKPANLVYGTAEEPPLGITVVSAIQHVGVIAIFMVYPILVAREAHAPAEEIQAIVRMAMLALSVAVVLQALPRGPVGSRFLAPSIFTGVYLAPSLMAARTGGLPLVWGMTMFAGLVEIALSRVWTRLRAFIPPETAGMVVFLVGVIIGLAALGVMLGGRHDGVLSGADALVAGCSIGVMIGLNIWNKGRLRLFCILIGMVVGYLLSAATGLLTSADLRSVLAAPLFALPQVSHISFAFQWSAVVPFAVTGLAAAMSVTAVVTTYQRLNDADWVRPEMKSISGGIFGDGIASMVAALFGTHGLTVSTANVGLVAATGVASRRIAFVIAGILALAAFQPTMIGVLTIMPPPVMAAALMFTAVFIMIGGLQIITSRVLDPRRTLVIGTGMMSFFVVEVYPGAFTGVPSWAQPLVTSPLVLATLVALALNLVFRIGIRRTVSMTVDPARLDLQDVYNFIERAAGSWGARRDVTTRVESAVQQAVEAVVEHCVVAGPVTLALSFDEFDVDAAISYNGKPLELPDRPPTQDELIERDDGVRLLAGFLVNRQADRSTIRTDKQTATLRLKFRH